MVGYFLSALVAAAPSSGWLGVSLADAWGGVWISAVDAGSPAARANLAKNDRVVEINGRAVTTSQQVIAMIAQMQPGQTVEVGIVRNGRRYLARARLAGAVAQPVSVSGGCPIGDEQNTAVGIARAHWDRLPLEQRPYCLYLSFDHLPADEWVGWGKVLAKDTAETSRAVVLDYHLPKLIGGQVYYLDLKELAWNPADVDRVLKSYPYFTAYDSRLFRPVVFGDWWIYELSDTTESTAYYDLLYGRENTPRNLAEFLKFWGIDQKVQAGFEFGLTEIRSGVGKQHARRVEHWYTATGGYYWRTKDVLEVKPGSDPLDAPDGKFKFDGSEHIVGIPKLSLASGARGFLQVYLLTNDQDQRVEEAPVDLVEDYTVFRGQRAIKTKGSCVQCHAPGINPPTESGVISLLASGVKLNALKDAEQAIAAFHLTDVGKEISRNNEDYAVAVLACGGLDPFVAAAAYKEAIDRYGCDVTLESAAAQLYVTPDELKYALLWADRRQYDLGVRADALLAHWAMPRPTFEVLYPQLAALLAKLRYYRLN